MFEAAPRVYVSWVELTEMPKMPFIELDGDEPDSLLLQDIRSVAQALDEETLLGLFEQEHTDDVTALSLFALGIGASQQPNPEVAALLEDGLVATSEMVRKGALLGVLYLPWRCGAESLERLKADDSSHENRELARRALARL